jgi:uncharacterized protein (DUF1015 family)
MTIVYPIAHAWLTSGGTGGTGARNYDEFADDAEITAIIEANPRSALAVEMPHRAPPSLGRSFAEALPAAVARLAEAKRDGAYRPAGDVVVLYRITGSGSVSYGLFGMVDTDQISASADEPGLVIRNEEVFPEKVRERVALAEATGHLLSPVLLLQTAHGRQLHAALAAACEQAGPAAASDVDQAGRVHEIWPLPPGPAADELRGLAGSGELVVADGNHRSLAAQTGGLRRFLAVVTTPESVTIRPYHRLITELPYPVAQLPRRSGIRTEAVSGDPPLPPPRGTAYLYTAGGFWRVALPGDPAASLVENLDHALVERRLVRDAFGLDPDDKRVVYVGGDYPMSWLRAEVDAGRADVAVLIAPVTTDDFVAVNLARQKLPRKSTWFTPKARAGLVLAELR